jgi:hypothetical protein
VNLLLVTLAGALGCVVRYLFEYSVRAHHPTLRPWATVGANALGCGIAGWAAYQLTSSMEVHIRTIVLTGFCGGLTPRQGTPLAIFRGDSGRHSPTLWSFFCSRSCTGALEVSRTYPHVGRSTKFEARRFGG